MGLATAIATQHRGHLARLGLRPAADVEVLVLRQGLAGHEAQAAEVLDGVHMKDVLWVDISDRMCE